MRLLAMGVPVDHARCCDLHIAALKSVFPVKEPDLSPILGGEWEDGEKVASCMFALDTCVPALSSSSCVGHWIQAACEFAGVIISFVADSHDADAMLFRLQACSTFDADAAASRWAILLEFVRDVTCSDTDANADSWVQLRAHHAAHITRALVATCYQISGVELVEGGRCPRRVAARLIVSAGRCLAAVIALSEASGWRLVGSTLLADVLETLRLGTTPLVNAWKLPVKDSDDAAADDDVAEYLGLCAQVCDAASSFIVTSSSSSTKKTGAAPAASHARAVLKLQVIAASCLCASHSQSAASRTTAIAKSAILLY